MESHASTNKSPSTSLDAIFFVLHLLFTLDLHLQPFTPITTSRAHSLTHTPRLLSTPPITYLQHPRPVKDSSRTNAMTDSANANFPHDQADDEATQMLSTSISSAMDDSITAAHLPLHKADHQSDAEMPATSTADAAADSVNDSFPREQADHQTSPELPSISMISAQTHGKDHAFDATDAAEAVLGIPELLLLIISEVPLNNRTSLRSVSKTWQAAVDRIGHVLEPAGYGCWGIGKAAVPSVPGYLVDMPMGLKLNRPSGLALRKIRAITYRDHYGVSGVGLGLYNRKKLLMHKQEFITDPPITQVLICANHTSISGVASLRIRGGIRTRDLLECLEKLNPSLSRTLSHAKYYVRFANQLRSNTERDLLIRGPRD